MEATAPAQQPTSSPLRYRNRDIDEQALAEVRAIVEKTWGRSRREMALALCREWDWRKVGGDWAEYACADLLRKLARRGDIELPRPRRVAHGQSERPSHPILPDDLIALPWWPVHGEDVDLADLVVRPVETDEREGWRRYMDRYHYLGYRVMVGEHLMYAAFLYGEVVALLGWASAALRVPARDRYIGWDEETKRRRLHRVANNVRFLIPPWVTVHNLASKVLGATVRRLSMDWHEAYGHPLDLAETFVDPRRFRGTCYRAANWQHVGRTAGRAKRGDQFVYHGFPKDVYVYELHRHARESLLGVGEDR